MSQVVIGSSFAQIHTMEVLNYMDCKSWIDESNRNQKRWEVPDSIGNNFRSSWDGHPARNELCLRYLMRFLWFLGFLSLAIQPEIINHSQNEWLKDRNVDRWIYLIYWRFSPLTRIQMFLWRFNMSVHFPSCTSGTLTVAPRQSSIVVAFWTIQLGFGSASGSCWSSDMMVINELTSALGSQGIAHVSMDMVDMFVMVASTEGSSMMVMDMVMAFMTWSAGFTPSKHKKRTFE